MPASRFAAWLGVRTHSRSGVTGVTGVTGIPKPSNSAGFEPAETVTPGPGEGVTGVTDRAASSEEERGARRAASQAGALARSLPFDQQAFLNEMHEGVILDTRRSRRGRRYRRSGG
jgi:hypothetical protein